MTPPPEYTPHQRVAAFRFGNGWCPYCGNRTIIKGRCATLGLHPSNEACGREIPATREDVLRMLAEIGK